MNNLVKTPFCTITLFFGPPVLILEGEDNMPEFVSLHYRREGACYSKCWSKGHPKPATEQGAKGLLVGPGRKGSSGPHFLIHSESVSFLCHIVHLVSVADHWEPSTQMTLFLRGFFRKPLQVLGASGLASLLCQSG